MKNLYILGYEGPNEIYQDVPGIPRNLISMEKFSNPEGEIVTCGSPYKFAMLNSPKTGHLGKTLISPNW